MGGGWVVDGNSDGDKRPARRCERHVSTPRGRSSAANRGIVDCDDMIVLGQAAAETATHPLPRPVVAHPDRAPKI